jgi:MFS family permease
MPPPHDPYAALRIPDYRRFLAGGVLAAVGSEIQAVVVSFELWVRTQQVVMLAWAPLMLFFPVLLLALPAGHAADRFNRKAIFQIAQGATALASLSLAALSYWQGPVELMFVCLALSGVSRAFNAPARSSLLYMVVPSDTLGNAVAWNSSGWQVASVSGPALGGVTMLLPNGFAASYVLAACCALGCVAVLTPIRPRQTERPASTRNLKALLAGVRFVWRTELLLAAITLDLFAVLLGGATALLPIYATDILKVGEIGMGLLRAAPAAGAVAMVFLLAHRPPLRRAGRALLASVAGFGIAIIVFGISENFYLSLAMLAVSGALDNVSVVVRGTLMQLLTPDEMRGRVAAVNTLFISSSNELGGFESAMMAKLLRPVGSVVFGGVGTLVVVGLVMWRWPRLAQLGALHELTPPSPPPAAVREEPSASARLALSSEEAERSEPEA